MNKLNKLSRWLFVFVAVLVVEAYLAQGHWKSGKELTRLQSQLDATGNVITRVELLQKDVQAQEAELAAARAQLSRNEALFPMKVDALEVVNVVVAARDGVDLYAVQQLPRTPSKLVNNTYDQGKYKVVAQGQLSYLGSLLDKIEAQSKPTWRIDGITLSPVTGNVSNLWRLEFNILTLARPEQGG